MTSTRPTDVTPPDAPGGPSAPRPGFPEMPGQAGLATRRQLRDLGWTAKQVRHRLAHDWQLIYPRVVAPHRHAIEGQDRLVAATLWAGPAAVLTGLAGLRLLGLDHQVESRTLSFLTADREWGKRHGDARVHRSDRAFTTHRRIAGIPVTTAARCLLDAAAWELHPTEEQMALTLAVLQQGLARPQDVHRELRCARRNHTRGVSQGVRAFERGAWSRPEAVLGELLDSSEVLPHVCLNPKLVLPDGTVRIPDGYLQEVALAIQVHSRTYHSREQDWQGTVEADADLIRAGIVVLGVTPRTLYDEGARFLRDVEQTATRLEGRPLPQIRMQSRCC